MALKAQYNFQNWSVIFQACIFQSSRVCNKTFLKCARIMYR